VPGDQPERLRVNVELVPLRRVEEAQDVDRVILQ
jgi:hypothetical protein